MQEHLFVEQQQVAHNCDVSQGDPLSNKECACSQCCIQHLQHLPDRALSLLCGLRNGQEDQTIAVYHAR